jgi:predicted site-specific integrase-resolvase
MVWGSSMAIRMVWGSSMTARATQFGHWPTAAELVDIGMQGQGGNLSAGTRPAAYLRTNTGARETLDLQLQWVQRIASAHGVDIGPDAVFVDQASGLDPARPGLAALRAAVLGGAIDTIVVVELARLSRDRAGLIELLGEFRDHGARVLHASSARPAPQG